MIVRYIGPHTTGVEVGALGVVVGYGETVEVPDDLAASLLDQPSNWEPVKAPTKKEADPAPTPKDESA